MIILEKYGFLFKMRCSTIFGIIFFNHWDTDTVLETCILNIKFQNENKAGLKN